MTVSEVLIREAMRILRLTLRRIIEDHKLAVEFSWPISGRAVSEIGGRLIEDFVLDKLDDRLFLDLEMPFDSVISSVPTSGKTLEDFSLKFSTNEKLEFVLHVDIKGHNMLRSGSRPNLASIRKCIALYSAESPITEELAIFYCRYVPNIRPNQRGEQMVLTIAGESFEETGTFLLRDLSEGNLDPANIGSGGQLLLAREDSIRVTPRTRTQFVALLESYSLRLQSRKAMR
jgi:hypothetical protein